jgi:potassium channel subfamily K protein
MIQPLVLFLGFGDNVPGTLPGNPNAEIELIATVFYIMIGVALLGMCFDLMQEEMLSKISWISQKLGLSKMDSNKASPFD